MEEFFKAALEPGKMVSTLCHPLIFLSRSFTRLSAVRCNNATKLALALNWAITDGPKIDLKHVVADVPAAMRALDIVVAHPSP